MGSPWWTEKMNPNEPFKAFAVTQEHVLSSAVFSHALSTEQDHRLELFFYFSPFYLFYIYIVLQDLKMKVLFVEFELRSLQVDERCNNQ